jgi:hypothetical protein
MTKENIMDEKKTQGLSEIDNVEIEPLSDEDLEGVAGGVCDTNSCSTSNCSNGKLPADTEPINT